MTAVMQPLSILLGELLQILQNLERPVVQLLRPGLSASTIDSLPEDLPIKLPDEIKQLYEWRNGVTEISKRRIEELCLFPNFYFPSLELALDEFRGWEELFKVNPPECLWRMEWFPIFMDVGGRYYAIHCDSQSAHCGGIVEFSADYGGELVFADLSKMVVSLTECYRQGVYFVGSNGRLTYDDKKSLPLFKALNPEIPAWSRRLAQMELIWKAGMG